MGNDDRPDWINLTQDRDTGGSIEGSYEHGNGCSNVIKFGYFLLAPLAM